MPNDEAGKSKLIQFIKQVVKGDLDEVRKEQQGLRDSVKSLLAEQLNLMSIIIRHHDCISQLQKVQTSLKKRLKAIQSGRTDKESEAEAEERGCTAHREGREKLRQILAENEGGDQTDITFDRESFDEILDAVEEIVEKSYAGLQQQEKEQGGLGGLQSIPSGMQIWTKQTYGDRAVVTKSPPNNSGESSPTVRPTTTILKTGRTFESIPSPQQQLSSSSRVPVSKLSLFMKESMSKTHGSTATSVVSRAGQGSSTTSSQLQQADYLVPRPGTYSRKKGKTKKEKLPKVDRIRTASTPMPPLNFSRLNHLQNMENMNFMAKREPQHHIQLGPLGSCPKVKSRFPPINNPQVIKTQQRLPGAKVIAPRASTKEVSHMSHWNPSRGLRNDLCPGSTTILRKPVARKLPSPRTRIREHFLNLKKRK